MQDRIDILESLVNFSKPIGALEKEVLSLPWDSDVELVEITELHLKNVEKRLEGGNLTEADVEVWANLIEGREDIKFQTDLVKESVEKLANPCLD